MSEIKIRVKVSTNKVGSQSVAEFMVDKEDWDDMDEQDREEHCREKMFELISWNYEEVSE